MNITICGVWELEDALQRPVNALVSVGDPGDALPPELANLDRPRLRLLFHDAWGLEDGVQRPEGWHLERLRRFLYGHRPESLLIHCFAGISRSPGLALAALVWTGDLPDAEVVAQVVAAQPLALPNPRIVRLLDELTGRDIQGALEAALPGWLREGECVT